jgi:methyl-accepting chemotaxis protein
MGAQKTLTISKKLVKSFSIILFLAMAIGCVGLYGLTKLESHTENMISGGMKGLGCLYETESLLRQISATENAMLIAHGDLALLKELRDTYDEKFRAVEDSWGEYKKIGITESTRGGVSRYEAAYENWKELSGRVIQDALSDTEAGRSQAAALALGDGKSSFENMDSQMSQLIRQAEASVDADGIAAREASKKYRIWVLVVTGITLLKGIFFIWLNNLGIVRILKDAIDRIREGADQVSGASHQISEASQSMAAGASEQAASIEETSAALEEISSMISQSSENSKHAENLMAEAKRVAENANDFMEQMSASMRDISSASEETSKIVKTIDEIAFQTNLLALNAAVEAARAGEAGAGFAVVADEVRNLAMRAAEAAQNTAELIDDTVKKVDSGAQLSETTRNEFTKVMESAIKVAQLIGEIAAASDEQALGIGQIGKAVEEMNRVTQQNAANAEESASSSEEMNVQANMMRSQLVALDSLVGSRNHGGNGSNHPPIDEPEGRKATQESPNRWRPKSLREYSATQKVVRPEQLIPMDDDGFEDF